MSVARCYARLSKSKCALNCPECSHRYIPADPLVAEYACPQCAAKAPHSLVPNSVAAQKHTLAEYVHKIKDTHGINDAPFYPDVISGKVDFDKRTAGARLLQDLQKGDHLIVVEFTRGWRSVPNFYHTLDLCLRMKVGIHILDLNLDLSTAMGEALGGLLAIFAQLERRLISERTIRGKAYLKSQGKPQNGFEPIGFEHWCKACGCRLPAGGGRYNQAVLDCPCGAIRRENTDVRVSTIDHAILRLILTWTDPGRHYHTNVETRELLKADGIKNPRTGKDFTRDGFDRWKKVARELEAEGKLLPLPRSEIETRNWLPEAIGQRAHGQNHKQNGAKV